MKDTNEKPTLAQIELEVKAKISGIAVMLNECLFPDAGKRMLGLANHSELEGDLINHIDLQNMNIARNLPVYYTYAYDGLLIPGYERELSGAGDNLERLTDFFFIFKPDGSYYDNCVEASAWDKDIQFGFVQDMLNRISARSSLDEGNSLSLSDIALLADMNERSVKNAVNADKDRLEINAQGEVENKIAKVWLNGRRGFIRTTIKDYPTELNVYPDDLTAVEIPAFIADRLIKIYAKSQIDAMEINLLLSPDCEFGLSTNSLLSDAAEIGKITVQELKDSLLQPLKLEPILISKIAKCIHVDVVWFNLQVMRAMYPSQVDMLLNPDYFTMAVPTIDETTTSIEVILTENMIKHGYIDIPSFFKGIFPPTCFGTRTDEGEIQIKIIYGKTESLTDVRVKSEKTISFRKRFGSWFRDVQVKDGDRISITKIGDANTNVYELVHLSK